MRIVYGIPNCDTIKKTKDWLGNNQVEYSFYDYKKQGITLAKIEDWLSQKTIEELINKAGSTWKKLNDEQKFGNLESLKALMIEKPSMIKRPIIEENGKIIALGFKEEIYQELFKKS